MAKRVMARKGKPRPDRSVYLRAWHAANPEAERAYSAGRRARRAGRPSTLTVAEWLAVLAKYGSRCALCGGSYDQIDHIVPFVMGGANVAANVRPMCTPCHATKSLVELSVAGRKGAAVTNSNPDVRHVFTREECSRGGSHGR